MEERIKILEQEIAAVKERNRKVEREKAWETSLFRILTISALTYGAAAALLYFSDAKNYWLGALVPAAGYFLSMRSLPTVKKWWLKRRLDKIGHE